MGQNQARNQFFCHFLKFSSLISLEIPYSDRMQQCITSTRGKPTREIFGDQIWVKRTKISPKIRFFAIFSNLIHQFFFKLHKMIAQNNVKQLVELKPARKLGGGGHIWVRQVKIRPKIRFFGHFFEFGSLVFLEIAQDDCFEHCLTTSRDKTHNFCVRVCVCGREGWRGEEEG